ncbi:MAG: hypothetical protein GY875_17785 [Gammaproteobacteria bacterium]|nr:hypothetical protein [Gammaproteobacteria bacterium]
MSGHEALADGVRNLLFDCADLAPGDSILIVYENPQTGWWDRDLVDTLVREAGSLGFSVDHMTTDAPANHKDDAIASAVARHSCTIFLARIGDQDHFAQPLPGKKIVVCYARDNDMLASDFGTTSFRAMKQLQLAVDQLVFSASSIEISCPQGTRISGSVTQTQPGDPFDVSVLRFPLGIGAPVCASGFSGRVSLNGYLTPTGSRVYHPANVKIDSPVFAIVEQGRIMQFEGKTGVVEAIDRHYRNIARQFDIDPYVVHSWHAGIHPGLTCSLSEDQDPDLWSNSVFNHPRYLHFHSCGNYPPGEVSWLLKDHRVSIDGVDLWTDGALKPENFDSTHQCLHEDPELAALYSTDTAL